MKQLLLTASLIALAQPALAQTVIEKDFTLEITQADGSEIVESTTLIPLLDGACYNWRLKLAKSKGDIEITETFTLPSAPASWGSTNESMVISEDNLSATSTMTLTPADGWISHGWCVAEGDPTGDHLFEIKSGDEVLGTFPFQVEEM